MQRILLEKRSRSDYLCGGMSVRAAADFRRERAQVEVHCAVPNAKRGAALHALEIYVVVWNVQVKVENPRVVPRIPY